MNVNLAYDAFKTSQSTDHTFRPIKAMIESQTEGHRNMKLNTADDGVLIEQLDQMRVPDDTRNQL